MRKITKVRLINFQCYEDRTFKFCPTTNGIVGDNNSGKSSLVRAIYWGANNKPAGDWMRRFDPEKDDGERLDTQAHYHFSDGTIIKRIKGDSVNEYWLDDEKFTSVGRGGAPDPIAEIFGTVALPFGKDLVPFIAMQDDKPFMVFESAPAKGSLLNYLTGVDVGDRMRKDLSRESRSITMELKRNAVVLDETETELLLYKNLDELQNRVDALTKLSALHEDTESKICAIGNERDNLKKATVKLNKYNEWLIKCKPLATQAKAYEANGYILELLQQLKQVSTQTTNILPLSARLNALGKLIEEQDTEVQKVLSMCGIASSLSDCEDDLYTANNDVKQLESELSKYQECKECSGTGVICHA